jgi:beta-arrestin
MTRIHDPDHRISDPAQKENLGIIVHYKVKVKLCLGPLGGDVVAELPFILMHPKPAEEFLYPIAKSADTDAHNDDKREVSEPVDHNLIQLET